MFGGILQTAKHHVISQSFSHHLNEGTGPDVPGRIAIAGGINHSFIDLSGNLRGLRQQIKGSPGARSAGPWQVDFEVSERVIVDRRPFDLILSIDAEIVVPHEFNPIFKPAMGVRDTQLIREIDAQPRR